MKIVILSQNLKIYSTKRLTEAARARGHTVQVVDVLRCFMNINSDKPYVFFKDKILQPKAVIPRLGASVTFYGAAVLRQFEMAGVCTLNGSLAITRSRDKLRAHQVLARKGLGMPSTSFAHSTNRASDLISSVGGAPLVIKLTEGAQGKGVILAETRKAAESLIEAFHGLNAYFLVQKFVAEAKGEDIRCFVIGDKVVASILRRAAEGDFRSNLHSGGTAEVVKITSEERKVAVSATKAMGLDIAGVDILRSHEGPLVLEVNSSPGLEGIEKATGLDIAGQMIEYLEKQVSVKKTSRVNKG